MHDQNDRGGPIQARSDLVDILRSNPENTDMLVTIIVAELKGLKDSDSEQRISRAVTEAAEESAADDSMVDNVLYWLTETSPDARQLILVKTIEELLSDSSVRSSALSALERVSSKENVEMVMQWVSKGIMKLDQAVYVLLYPDASEALK